jgi:hypothetical protein
MVETNSVNPNSLARQSREKAIRQAEENYKKDLDAATKAMQSASNKATTAKVDAVKQAKAALEQPKTRLKEARDRIEANLCKRDLDTVRRAQEQMLTSSEGTFLKAIKQAKVLGKHLAAEAAKNRRQAIQQAYDIEKQVNLGAKQALKRQKDASIRTREGFEKPRRKAKKEKPASKPITKKGVPKVPPDLIEAGKSGSAVSRTGMSKLLVTLTSADSLHMVDFENSLRHNPDIRLVMIGGTTSEGAEIIVSSEKCVALSDTLRQLPMVEKVTDRHSDILIKLKPDSILGSKI